MSNELCYGIWLADAVASRGEVYRYLLERFGNARSVFEHSFSNEKADGLITRKILRSLKNKDLSSAVSIVDYCATNRIGVLFCTDGTYPRLLREIPDSPAALYVMGNMPDFERFPATAVVGTRKMTEYGMHVAYQLGYGLARGGSVVVSGMAAGGDSMALCGALDAGGIPVAVLGCGLDRAYPVKNAKLMREIASKGAVISEFAPGTEIRKQNFPQRNRIISGLSRAVCVTEASEKSGALITARHALEQTREVYAVPGNLGASGSAGVNMLIKDGASVLTGAEDVLRQYAFLYPNAITLTPIDARSIDDALLSARAHSADTGALDIDIPTDEYIAEEKRPTVRIKERESDINITVREEMKAVSEEELMLVDTKTREVFYALPEGEFTAESAVTKQLSVTDILCALTLLEINGFVRALPGGKYQKAKLSK